MTQKYLLVCLLLFAASKAQGGILASYSHQFGGGGPGIARPYLDYEIRTFDRTLKLFDELVVDATDVGTTYIANSANSTTFSSFDELFTNGFEDKFWIMRLDSHLPNGGGSGGGSLISELVLFQELDGVDLNAYILESIQLSIDEITYYTDYISPFNPNRVHDHWTNSSITISFHGSAAVPSPGAMPLIVAGLFLLLITSQGSKGASRRDCLSAAPA